MKKTVILFALLLTLLFPHTAEATSSMTASTETIEYLSDGSYYLTTISVYDVTNINRATNTRLASKTRSYVDASGTTLWSFTVTGSFAYNGFTCVCGQATISTNVYSDDWKITSASAVPKSNTAVGNVTAKQYVNNTLVRTITDSVILTCDVNGNIS